MDLWDIIIIGGGPAGLTAGIYAARGGMKTLLIESMYPGGQAAISFWIENYPGFVNGMGGAELGAEMEKQAKRFGVEVVYSAVEAISLQGEVKTVKTPKASYQTKAVILAMGATHKRMGFFNEGRYEGSGISYCATCDGAFYRNMEVAVVGGGDSAVEEALFLTQYCKKVHLIHRRDALRAEQSLQERILKNPKVEIHWDHVITELQGEPKLDELTLKNVKTGDESRLAVAALFVAIGRIPTNGLVEGQVALDDNGYILANEEMSVNIPGVFVAGDLRQKPLRQIVTAAADGAIAAWSAQRYVIGMS